MAHFAQLDENNLVIQVVVVNNEDVGNLEFPESEPLGIAFLQQLLGTEAVWKQTSYNNNFRKNYAQIGSTYDAERNAFIHPQPYPSWVLNEETCLWESPVPHPNDYGTLEDPKSYNWDENILNWVEVTK
jgi:hypothetical protein